MNSHLSGIIAKPHLYIETQFSQQEQQDRISNFNRFQFEPKDAISEIGNINHYQGQTSQDEIIQNQTDDERNYNNIIEGLVHLEQITNSWEINALYDSFQMLKLVNCPSLKSFYYDRSSDKELLPNKSVINLRNNNHLLKQHHQRKVTSSSSNQKSLERAQVLNQIITKLYSREKSLRGNQSYNSNNSYKSIQKKQTAKGKLNKLSNMLKGYKIQNQKSNKQSAIMYKNYYNKTNLQQSKMIKSQCSSKAQISAFKKLKNEIMQVKSQVKQLKHINQIYRRQNYYLRNDRMSEQHATTKKREFQNLSTDREIKFNNFYIGKKYNQRQSYLQHNHSQPIFMNNSPLETNSYIVPLVTYQIPSNQYVQKNYHSQNQQASNNYLSPPNRCNNARHQNNWRTMLPDDSIIDYSGINSLRNKPILFCYKCGCKCASNNEKHNITQRKRKIQSPRHLLNNLF